MSNIPFNTVASILTTGNVHRQVAAGSAKRTQDDKQLQQVFKVETQKHSQEVEDLEDTAVDAVGEEPEKHQQQQDSKKRQQEEQAAQREVVDIAQLSAEAANAPAGVVRPKVPAVVRPVLDIRG